MPNRPISFQPSPTAIQKFHYEKLDKMSVREAFDTFLYYKGACATLGHALIRCKVSNLGMLEGQHTEPRAPG